MRHIRDIYGWDTADHYDPSLRGRDPKEPRRSIRASIAAGAETHFGQTMGQGVMVDLSRRSYSWTSRYGSEWKLADNRIILDAQAARELARTLLEAADTLDYQTAVRDDGCRE